jgi:hypothetical protein
MVGQQLPLLCVASVTLPALLHALATRQLCGAVWHTGCASSGAPNGCDGLIQHEHSCAQTSLRTLLVLPLVQAVAATMAAGSKQALQGMQQKRTRPAGSKKGSQARQAWAQQQQQQCR